MFGGNVGDVGNRERQDRFERRVRYPLADRRVDKRNDDTEEHPAHGGNDERPADLQNRKRAADRHDRRSQRGQRGGVVDETFALENLDDRAWHSHSARDGTGRNGVRRGNDRSERKASC